MVRTVASAECNLGIRTRSSHEPLSIPILGSWVQLVDACQSARVIEDWIRSGDGNCRRVIVTGFHGIWMAHQSLRFREAARTAELWVPDGIAPVWLARLRGHSHVKRCTGAELMSAFFALGNCCGYRSYFYGGTRTTLDGLRARLEIDFPGHIVAGMCSPPFRELTPEEDNQVIAAINEAKPDVLWVGLGLPKQEEWIFERMARLRVPVAIGVGAAFSFLAGTVERCPERIGNAGLEWAYRLWKEPRKLWRRDLLDGPRFLIHAALELAGLRSYE